LYGFHHQLLLLELLEDLKQLLNYGLLLLDLTVEDLVLLVDLVDHELFKQDNVLIQKKEILYTK
jgi:hypothetical protein